MGAAVRSYMDSLYAPGEPWPIRLLVQFIRASGNYEISFEESDSSRWKLTPDKRADTLHAELRPAF